MCRTCLYALTTQATLIEVDIAEIVLDGDSLELTFFLALTTTDTSNGTSFLGDSALLLIDTRHIDAAVLHSLLAKFDNVARTCLDTCTTSNALVVVNLRQASLLIHMDSVKLTCGNTVATTQTAKATCRLACSGRVHSIAGAQTAILSDARTILTRAVTSHNSHLGLSIRNSHT